MTIPKHQTTVKRVKGAKGLSYWKAPENPHILEVGTTNLILPIHEFARDYVVYAFENLGCYQRDYKDYKHLRGAK